MTKVTRCAFCGVKLNLELNTCPGLKIGDFGDQDDQARILSLNKTNFELKRSPGQKIGDFAD